MTVHMGTEPLFVRRSVKHAGYELMIGKLDTDEPLDSQRTFTYPLFGDQPEGPVTRIALTPELAARSLLTLA